MAVVEQNKISKPIYDKQFQASVNSKRNGGTFVLDTREHKPWPVLKHFLFALQSAFSQISGDVSVGEQQVTPSPS